MKFELFKSRAVIPHLTPSVKQCLYAIQQGKPLPGGVQLRQNPSYRNDGVFDFKTGDEFLEMEQARQRTEAARAAVDSAVRQAKANKQTSDATSSAQSETSAAPGEPKPAEASKVEPKKD